MEIPFERQFAADEQDKELMAAAQELPGILNWAVRVVALADRGSIAPQLLRQVLNIAQKWILRSFVTEGVGCPSERIQVGSLYQQYTTMQVIYKQPLKKRNLAKH